MTRLHYLTRTEFDFGVISQLPQILKETGIKRPLLCTDKGLIKVGIVARVCETLGNEISPVLFDGTPENPTEEAVEEALDLYKREKCDGILCVGGGSPMDLGKAVGILISNPPPLAQYALMEGGGDKIAPLPPLIAVPTTSGTGSEVSVGSVIITKDGRKLTFAGKGQGLIPLVAVCDPELTLGLPPQLTAGTGMDAMTHCIEAVLSPIVNPPAEAVGLDGLRRGIREGWLEKAYQDGTDRDARWNMMMASSEGAMAFIMGLGAVHAMSHACGRIRSLRLHHGTLNAIFLPTVLRFNRDHTGDKYDRLREAMGLSATADLAEEITALNARLGLPPNLSAVGITGNESGLIENAVSDACSLTNPRPASAKDYEAMYKEALG